MGGDGSFWRYLGGVALAQAAAAGAAVAVITGDDPAGWAASIFAALAAGAFAAWCFVLLGSAERRVEAARTEVRIAREREKLSVSLERRRADEARRDVREAAQAQAQAGRASMLRYGLIGGGAAGVGLALMAAQFVTLGLAALALAGGGWLGWRLRRRATATLVDVTPPQDAKRLKRAAGAPAARTGKG